MITFLAIEFIDLPAPERPSLGLVTLDGREPCFELDQSTDAGNARAKASGNFVRAGVLDMWSPMHGAADTEWLLGLAAESGGRIEVAFDYRTVYELMENVIRDSGLWNRSREVVSPVNVGLLSVAIDGDAGFQV